MRRAVAHLEALAATIETARGVIKGASGDVGVVHVKAVAARLQMNINRIDVARHGEFGVGLERAQFLALDGGLVDQFVILAINLGLGGFPHEVLGGAPHRGPGLEILFIEHLLAKFVAVFEVATLLFLESGLGLLLIDLLEAGREVEVDVPFQVQDERVARVFIVIGFEKDMIDDRHASDLLSRIDLLDPYYITSSAVGVRLWACPPAS